MNAAQTNFQEKENGLPNLVKNGFLESVEKAFYKDEWIYEVRIKGALHYVKWDTGTKCWVIENVSGNRWYPLELFPRLR